MYPGTAEVPGGGEVSPHALRQGQSVPVFTGANGFVELFRTALALVSSSGHRTGHMLVHRDA